MTYTYYYWRVRGPRFGMNEPASIVVYTQDNEMLCDCGMPPPCFHMGQVLDKFEAIPLAILCSVNDEGDLTELPYRESRSYGGNRLAEMKKNWKRNPNLSIANGRLWGFLLPKPPPPRQTIFQGVGYVTATKIEPKTVPQIILRPKRKIEKVGDDNDS